MADITIATSAGAQTTPAQRAWAATATRWPRMWGGAPASEVNTVTASAAGAGRPALDAPSASPSTPARSMVAPAKACMVR